ncbi:energy-coupling factor transporter transmembrane component T [Microbacterium sufflavum]|uniref:Energy-coupling factor transporter transmembrane protein EcfT n=1 Tax=Microbacterium sufflavum TaxID=2851649 RepID=A0ABY4IG95_9MICO|nr:energy-coupling factor transporter transmembrane component T [Microbacterium sufflavum]UPL10986.1 energy-coupling factor transporter transmembrane protein EcfT [Microbacterium sufflavum]
MSGSTGTAFDPYARLTATAPHQFLYALNPLAKVAGFAPGMVLLVFVRDLATPAAFLALAYVLILSGARVTGRLLALLLLGLPLGMLAVTVGFSLWVDVARVDGTPALLSVGDWRLYSGALTIGAATALRLGAIVALALVAGLTTSGSDLVRASVQQLRVPYRIGYTALAAFRFVPRFGHELAVIRAAHRVRGYHGGRGPLSRIARGWGYIVPLLAGAIRHAERVALAMDSRAFGAHPTRTERHLVPFRVRDTVFTVAMLLTSAAIFLVFFPWQLPLS